MVSALNKWKINGVEVLYTVFDDLSKMFKRKDQRGTLQHNTSAQLVAIKDDQLKWLLWV